MFLDSNTTSNVQSAPRVLVMSRHKESSGITELRQLKARYDCGELSTASYHARKRRVVDKVTGTLKSKPGLPPVRGAAGALVADTGRNRLGTSL